MTREEAISHIEYSIKAYQNLIENDARSGEAIGKDIKGEWKSEKTLADAYMVMIESLKMAIKALKQEPKTGHWIPHNESITLLTGEIATGGVICSECGYKTHNKAHVIYGCPYKYCPDCGSKNE